MNPPTPSDLDYLTTRLSTTLSSTPYACSTLTQLSGGTTSFVFRGQLIRSSNNESTVIIKHAENFISCNKAFPIDSARAEFEALILRALDGGIVLFERANHGDEILGTGNSTEDEDVGVRVQIVTPKLLHYIPTQALQVMQDFPSTVDLRTALPTLSETQTRSIGLALGSWLKRLHTWGSARQQSELRDDLARNQSMRELKQRISFNAFMSVLENFPEILDPRRGVLEDVQRTLGAEFDAPASISTPEPRAGEERHGAGEGDCDVGIIHGDLWAGNVLVQSPSIHDSSSGSSASLVVIDWESAQVSHRSLDLGEFIGDLYETHHYQHTLTTTPATLTCNCQQLLLSFLSGYSPTTATLLSRSAIYVGIHLICWARRGPPEFWKGWDPVLVREGMKIGVELIVRGWEGDGAVLEELFAGR